MYCVVVESWMVVLAWTMSRNHWRSLKLRNGADIVLLDVFGARQGWCQNA